MQYKTYLKKIKKLPIQVLFDAPIMQSTVFGSLLLLEEGTVEIAGNLQLIGDGSELLFTPNGLLEDHTSYTVRISGIKDRAGNSLASTVESTFTTGNTIDTQAPTVEINPPHNRGRVAVNTLVTAVFSERIDPATVDNNAFYITDTVTNQRVDGALNWLNNNQTLNFIPDTAYWVGRQYRINLTDQIKDLFGNNNNSSAGKRGALREDGGSNKTKRPRVNKSS